MEILLLLPYILNMASDGLHFSIYSTQLNAVAFIIVCSQTFVCFHICPSKHQLHTDKQHHKMPDNV